MDPIKLLTKQHREVEALFARHEGEGGDRRGLFEQIERNILAHSLLEETQVYPMLRERAPDGEPLAEHALEEHKKVEMMLKRLASMGPESDEYESTMQELMQSVRHHVKEEEEDGGLFDKLREAVSQGELAELGRTLSQEAGEEPMRSRQGGRRGENGSGRSGQRGQGSRTGQDAQSGQGGQSASNGRQRSGSRAQRSSTRKRAASSRTRSSGTGRTGSRSSSAGARGRAATRGSRKSSSGAAARRRSGAKRPQAAKRPARSRTKARRR